TCASVISTNCTGDAPFSPACVPAGTLPISAWLYGATNKDNTARLEILEEVGTDDAYTNYIQGDETGLNIDVLYDQDTLRAGAIIRSGVLSITDLDNVNDNATGGVATARISSPEFTDNPLGTKHRYYAGLLSNVDLGGPLIDNSADGIWNASFYVLYGTSSGRAQADIETSLIVNFDAKSIKTRELADIYGPADPVVLGAGAGRITINANFTTAGLIYGRSSWSDGRLDGNSSAGTLTGLIGKYGAIGAFVGSGKNISGNTQGEYAGGFVAAPVDCTRQTGNPFYRLCDASTEPVMMAQDAVCDADMTRAFDPLCADYTMPEQKTAFAEICRLNADAKGCDLPINGISGLTVAECADNDTGNPYQTGCADDIFDAERTARNLSCGLDVSNAGQCGEALTACFGSATDTGCDVFVKAICDVSVGRDGRCDTQVPNICGAGGTDPLSVICETGYDSVRQELCDGQDIANPSNSRCLPVIATLCNDDPFATAAGAGTATFDCTEGDTYLPARVTACENDIDVNGGAGGCDATRTTACPTNPFSSFCDSTYQPARDTACRANPGAYGLQCDHLKAACTVTVNADVLVNYLNDICRDDPRYAVDRENNCLTDERGDVVSRNNGNDRYTICAGVQKSVIAYRCGLEPFNPKAGVSTRKFDCSTLDTFIVDGKTIDFSGFAQIRSDRVTLCKNPANRQDALCQVPSTQAFLARCARDPFDAPCVAIGDPYETDRANRITNCLIDASPLECTHQ
ncbi:MAG: hypothetical protein K8953_04575, partial [Proteobacteria bacterium]|nr:hypothetical protein [Pseudomonadota bacterium]